MRAAPQDAGHDSLGGTPGADPGASTEKVLAIVKDPSDPRHPRCATPVTGNRLSSLPRDDGHIMEDPNATLEDDTVTVYTGAITDSIEAAMSKGMPPVVLPHLASQPTPQVPQVPAETVPVNTFEINSTSAEHAEIPPRWKSCTFLFYEKIKEDDGKVVADFASNFNVDVKCFNRYGIIQITKREDKPFTEVQNSELLYIIKKNIKLSPKFVARFDPFSL